MNGKISHDRIETAQAVEAHGADVAYRHMLTRERARVAVGNKHNTSLALYAVFEDTSALDTRGVDTSNQWAQGIVDDMEAGK